MRLPLFPLALVLSGGLFAGEAPVERPPAENPRELFKSLDLTDLDNINLVLAAVVDREGWPKNVKRISARASFIDKQFHATVSVDVENFENVEYIAALAAAQAGKVLALNAPIKRVIAVYTAPTGTTASIVLPIPYVKSFGLLRMEGKQVTPELFSEFVNSCSWDDLLQMKTVASAFPNVQLSEADKTAALLQFAQEKASRAPETGKAEGATVYVLKDGAEIRAVKVIDAGDRYSVKDAAGNFVTIMKADVVKTVDPSALPKK